MHPNVRHIAAVLITLVFVMITSVIVLRAAAHSWRIPECWSCGAVKVRRSESYSITDAALKFLYLIPYRCRGCRVRFYGIRAAAWKALPDDHP
jgi:hypothetical protein